MALWDDDLEAMRPTLRAEADAMLAAWPSRADEPSMSIAERVAAHREELGAGVPPSDKAVDRTIPGPAGPVRIRTIVPETVDAVFLHIHGGGFVSGAPEMTDILHEILSAELNLAFVSVDYRLAPEHPYPAGPDDCEAAGVWLLEHAEAEYGASQLLIGGESAGAHLSACTLLRMRDRHDAIERFLGANLVFGIFDVGGTPSQRGVGAGPDILSVSQIEFFSELFTPGMTNEERSNNTDLSPLYADLRGLVPALFTVGTADHLIDDTLFMADRWELAGNRTERLVYPESPHACIAMPTVGGHWFPRLTEFLRGCIKG
jgi:acetyl esterase/lipase